MRITLLLIILYFFCSLSVVGAEKKPKDRLKIGLVLSGGGAKGAAHIGVLKILEQYHIPIDYVVGTSIGAYVGGLYALGYQADQIEKIMLNLPWDESYSDFIPRESLSLKDKNHRDQYNISLRLGYSDGELKAPSGLLLGQSASNLLKFSTDVVAKIDNFDNLAIPYRAIATNLATAKAVVLQKGSITKAMRASAAVPGVVDPVEIDDQLLVDGGIANNMPIDVVKAMGADIVIAVDIGSPLLAKAAINDTIDVINQLSTILTNNTTLAQMKYLSARDVLIRPKIDNLSTTDFTVMPEALTLGEEAALIAKDKLMLLSVSEQEYLEYHQQIDQKKQAWFDSFLLPVIEIEYQNHSQISLAAIKESFALPLGKVITKEELQLAINRVYALNEFEHVDAEFVDMPNGRKLIVVTQEKTWGPDYLSFGFNLQTDFSYRSIASLDFAYTQNNISRYGGKWLNEAEIGWETTLASEIYQPLVENQSYFSRARIEYSQDKWEPTVDRPELTNKYFKANIGLGNLKIMLPMISGTEEVDESLALFEQAYFELSEKYPEQTIERPDIGIMLEVPSSVFMLPEWSKKVDFCSVGSNDLTQYLLAVDRANARVAELFNPYHPGVLRVLNKVARECEQYELPFSLCGELGGDPEGAILLIAMGYRRLSMNLSSLNKVKWVLRRLNVSDMEQLLSECLAQSTAKQVLRLTRSFMLEHKLGDLFYTPK